MNVLNELLLNNVYCFSQIFSVDPLGNTNIRKPSEFSKVVYNKPFVVTSTEGKFHFLAKIIGGGKEGQLKSLSLALSRAILKNDIETKPSLRANDLLTVDARVRQRRHIGTGGKARRTKQSPRR